VSTVSFVTSKVLSQDGIDYTIGVYRNSVGVFAIWDCKACDREGQGTEPMPEVDSAINACRVLIDQHHARHHSRQ
jgi:hypothetical protein